MTSIKYFLIFISLISLQATAQDSLKIMNRLLRLSDISGQYFIAANYNEADSINKMELKRGYFTIKTNINKNFSTRYTQDITIDNEGNDAGNVEMRLKYLYLKAKINVFNKSQEGYFEFGLVHRPWIDFEQKINRYRVQAKMFIETSKIINSADFGILYEGLIGGKIDDKYQKTVNSAFPGKYGSFSLGVYNGGGYHAIETNNNKTLEGRLSLRPFPSFIPGLQATYAFAFGKANLQENLSDFNMHLFYLSSESKYHVLAFQYYRGVGDYSGRYINPDLSSTQNEGYSIFMEGKIPKSNFSIIGRYDYFKSEFNNNITQNNILGGIAYHFQKNKVLLNFEYDENPFFINRIYELALEIKF